MPTRAGFDLPAFPTVDKDFVAVVSALLMCAVFGRKAQTQNRLVQREGRSQQRLLQPDLAEINSLIFVPKRGNKIFWGLIGLATLSPVMTVLQNAEPAIRGPGFIPGLRPYDAFSIALTLLVTILPFLLGRRYLASESAQKLLLKGIALALLIYSFLALYEVRMSPQLNTMFYGFFPHSWAQHVRGDGYRPLVFLPHGLILSIFLGMGAASAFAYWRCQADKLKAAKWLLVGLWIFGTLVLSKSLGALVLTILFCPVILFLGVRSQTIIAALFAGVVLTYPMLRSADLIPVEAIHNAAQSIDEGRAQSLKYRLDNEDRLIEKAQQKPLAGWGGWGRSRVYDESGWDITTTDGYWVIVIGAAGWLGYLAHFGLLCIPLVLLGIKGRKLDLTIATSSLGIVHCIAIIDLLPNASVSPVLWLIAGSVMGRFQTANTRADLLAAKEEPLTSSDTPRERQSRPDTPTAPELHVRVPR
ncbi:hypothetical protein [Roseovarius albus]|uniref:hypothetical protein n=1 Tax=Roseovarius albus TaxID=1247867 RepID=UPI001F28CD1B|nr:hypothetical protein [Roseovarius albus]